MGTSHYTCAGDDVEGEVMGQAARVCGPRCALGTFECPGDVPPGTLAEPQCMLQDADQVSYCALFCEMDGQCPSGSKCWRSAAMEDGLCIYPLSFSEWAKASTRRKMDVTNVPSAQAGTSAKGSRI